MPEEKTNVMRLLEKAGVAYTPHFYTHDDGAIDAVSVAQKLGQNPARVFKTLVTQGAARKYYVFVIPAGCELHLKHAAKAVGEKSIAMLPVAELLKTTGYVRGGCSPIGMKKPFVTVLDESALAQPTIMVSAGRIGAQVELAPAALAEFVRAKTAGLVCPQ